MITTSSTTKIIETSSFEEVFDHLSPETILFCDLDNTIMEVTQHFGSVQWGDNHKEKLINSGESSEKAEEILHNLWFGILPHISMQLVDEQIPQIIQSIQKMGHFVLGLTARYPKEAWYTHPHLNRFQINFDKFFPDQHIPLESPILYENGILFCGTQIKKSDALMAFLQLHNLTPKKIIFIDDKLHHVQDLEAPLTSANIEYVGIRYSKCDQRVKDYDEKIANIQWKLFPTFISDKDAEKNE